MQKVSITEINGSNTFMYSVINSDSENIENVKIKKIETETKNIDKDKKIRIFNLSSQDNEIIVITVMEDKVVINGAKVKNGVFNISTKPRGIRYTKQEIGVKEEVEFIYEYSEERRIYIIDVDTGEEVNSGIHIREGRKYRTCKIIPEKKYLAFEYRTGGQKVVGAGICSFNEQMDKYEVKINELETNRVDFENILTEIENGNKQEITMQELNKDMEGR